MNAPQLHFGLTRLIDEAVYERDKPIALVTVKSWAQQMSVPDPLVVEGGAGRIGGVAGNAGEVVLKRMRQIVRIAASNDLFSPLVSSPTRYNHLK